MAEKRLKGRFGSEPDRGQKGGQRSRKHRVGRGIWLTLMFSTIFFLIMLGSMAITYLCIMVLSHTSLALGEGEIPHSPLLFFAILSLVIGTVLTVIVGRRPLAPIRAFMDATNRIAAGDYTARLDMDLPGYLEDVQTSFNHMAQELGSVELLRTDFVNNFSHEFKTPIVSICGFARMLERDDLTDEERREYLDIIISESDRLAVLSENVLLLSKLEQQAILTDVGRFRLTEQIRLVTAMMDSKWRSKEYEVDFDCPEISYTGSEDLLKQVWINLLDNAIKFSPEGGCVKVRMASGEDAVRVEVCNEGPEIPEESLAHLFDRFYQGDLSHAAQGHGLGLTIARRIVQMHGGTIQASSREGETLFAVSLP